MQNATNKKKFSCFRIVSRAKISTHCFWLSFPSKKKKKKKESARKNKKRSEGKKKNGAPATSQRMKERKKEKERFETRLFRERMYYTVLMTMSEAVFELEIRRCLLNPRTRRASTSNRFYKHGRFFRVANIIDFFVDIPRRVDLMLTFCAQLQRNCFERAHDHC